MMNRFLGLFYDKNVKNVDKLHKVSQNKSANPLYPNISKLSCLNGSLLFAKFSILKYASLPIIFTTFQTTTV